MPSDQEVFSWPPTDALLVLGLFAVVLRFAFEEAFPSTYAYTGDQLT